MRRTPTKLMGRRGLVFKPTAPASAAQPRQFGATLREPRVPRRRGGSAAMGAQMESLFGQTIGQIGYPLSHSLR